MHTDNCLCRGTGFVECSDCYGINRNPDGLSQVFVIATDIFPGTWVICKQCQGKGEIPCTSETQGEGYVY